MNEDEEKIKRKTVERRGGEERSNGNYLVRVEHEQRRSE